MLSEDSSRTQLERTPATAASNSTTQRPVALISSAARRSTRHGSPPRPTLPSASSTVSHRPVPGSGSNRSPQQTGARCAGPGAPPSRTGRHRAPESRAGSGASPNALGHNPNRSSDPGRARRPHGRSTGRHHGRPANCAPAVGAAGRRRAGANIVHHPTPLRRAVRACQTPASRVVAANRPNGPHSLRTATMSSTVSTSRSSGTSVTTTPVCCRARSVTAPVSDRDIGVEQTLCRRRLGDAEHPPAAVARHAQHRGRAQAVRGRSR